MESKCFKRLEEILQYEDVIIYGEHIVVDIFFQVIQLCMTNDNYSASVQNLYKIDSIDELKSIQCKNESIVVCFGINEFLTKNFLKAIRKKTKMLVDGSPILFCNYEEIEFEVREIQESNIENVETILEIEIIESLNRMVEVVHFGRSGSIHVHTLLDGHPNLIGYPAGIFYTPHYELYKLFLTTRGRATIEEIANALLPKREVGGGYEGDIWIEKTIHANFNFELRTLALYDKLCRILKEYSKNRQRVSESFIFKALNYTYSIIFREQKINWNEKNWILNQIHSRDYRFINKYLKLVNEVKVIITIRNPVSNLESIWKSLDVHGNLNFNRALNAFQYVYINPLIMGIGKERKLYLVQIEKINQSKFDLMTKILAVMGLPMVSECLYPSIDGIGVIDSYGKSKSEKLNIPSPDRKKIEGFNESGIHVLQILFGEMSKKMGYLQAGEDTAANCDVISAENNLTFNQRLEIVSGTLECIRDLLEPAKADIIQILDHSDVL